MAAVVGGSTYLADYTALAAASINKPLVRLIQQSAQSLASNTDVAITFGASSEDVDTHGFHDTSTNTSRITPTVGGWYRLTGTVAYAADTDLVDYYASFGKNGSIITPRVRTILASTATTSTGRAIQVVVMQQANGSTDYFELFGRQLQAAAASLNTNAGATTLASVFECEYLRPL